MKKFFLVGALTACLLMTNCADVSAESIDFHATNNTVKTFSVGTGSKEIISENFSKVQKAQVNRDDARSFNNYVDLIEYLNDCKNNLKTVVPVKFTDGFFPDNRYIVSVRAFYHMSYTDYGDGTMIYELTNYPGERVAYAHTHNDTSFLTDEERELYNVAVQIVNNAKNFSNDPMYLELYIHDAITDRATYYTENPQPRYARFLTASGALLDGKANCQGYADAFYMLATMCGLNVDKVCGIAARRGSGQEHMWNSVDFGSSSYFVDVTFDDGVCKFGGENLNSYVYFNAPTVIMDKTHRWYKDNVPANLKQNPDSRNYFHADEYADSNGEYFGTSATSAQSALDCIAERIANQKYEISRVEAPYDSRYADQRSAIEYLTTVLKNNYNWKGLTAIVIEKRGNYMYYTVKTS